MKRAGKPVFFITALVILFVSYAAFFGIYTERGDLKVPVIKGASDIRWGIDIRGGVEATFYPVDDQGEPLTATREHLDAAQSIIGVRLVDKHVTDYELYTDYDNSRIIVRFPWREDETEFDPEAAIQEISMTAMLTFREGYETKNVTDENGNVIGMEPDGVTAETIILNGDDIEKAEAYYDSSKVGSSGAYGVSLTLKEEGAKKFAEATGRLYNATTNKRGYISIWLDNTMISYPRVDAVIEEGVATISGNFTAEEATDLANKINAGALPFKLETSSFGSISPQLGASALNAMLIAGVAALAIICIFMILTYRLPGVVASIALLGQVAGMIAAVSGFLPAIGSFTLTLPGIAGMILSIGMGVDANVITNERIKEEVRKGKSLDAAIDSGSSESFSAIFDGNVTVIIVAIILMGVFGPPNSFWSKLLTPVLFMFGTSTTGAVYSFGYTLLIGVVFNFIMGVTASRLMIKSLSRFKAFRNKWLYGGEKA